MNKEDITEFVASCAGVSKAVAKRCIDCYHKAIQGALKKEQSVNFVGFGTFSVANRKARKGRNPRTGKEIKIAAKKVPKFTAGKAFKDAVYRLK